MIGRRTIFDPRLPYRFPWRLQNGGISSLSFMAITLAIESALAAKPTHGRKSLRLLDATPAGPVLRVLSLLFSSIGEPRPRTHIPRRMPPQVQSTMAWHLFSDTPCLWIKRMRSTGRTISPLMIGSIDSSVIQSAARCQAYLTGGSLSPNRGESYQVSGTQR